MESFRPGVLEKLGLSPAHMLQIRPSLVVCRISGYGQSGPEHLSAGHDVNYLARAGVLGMMRDPTVLPVQVADICAGAFPAVVQIMAGLLRRSRTGVGSVIDVGGHDAAPSVCAM